MHSYVYIYICVCVYITGEFHNSFETNKICARPNGNPCPLVWGPCIPIQFLTCLGMEMGRLFGCEKYMHFYVYMYI